MKKGGVIGLIFIALSFIIAIVNLSVTAAVIGLNNTKMSLILGPLLFLMIGIVLVLYQRAIDKHARDFYPNS